MRSAGVSRAEEPLLFQFLIRGEMGPGDAVGGREVSCLMMKAARRFAVAAW